MAQMRKFTFDNLDFDDPSGRYGKQKEPPPPTFSEAELAAARQEGYAAGLRDAEAASTQSQNAQALRLVQGIAGQLQTMIAAEREAAKMRSHAAVELSLTLMQRVLPTMARRNALTEIEAILRDRLAELTEEPRVVIRVNDILLDDMREKFDALEQTKGFAGDLVLLADDRVAETDCLIEWADGGAERRYERLWADLEETVRRVLAMPEDVIAGVIEDVEAVPVGRPGGPDGSTG